MQTRQSLGSTRVHPTLEVRPSTLNRGTIEDIPMDQVDLAQASSFYGRKHAEPRYLSREKSPEALQSRISTLSEMHTPYLSKRPKTVKDQQDRRIQYIEELRLFIRQHFHQKECGMFVPVANQKVKKVRLLKCHCGEVLLEHAGMRNGEKTIIAKVGNVFLESLYLIPKELQPYISSHKLDEEPSPRMPELQWSGDKNIRTTVTTTFGKINFVNVEHHGGKKPAKFVRISDKDSIDDLMELMTEHWNIMKPQEPNLVISVVGGAKNFKLDGRMRDTFSTGLIKTAKTTSAWLITSGFNMGVMKAVGQAVRQGQSFCWDEERMAHVLRCIGFAPWGYVMDRKKLESEDGMGSFNVDFRMSNAILHGQPVPLNADHTHFIFVDDGFRNRYAGVAEVRSKFEQKVFKPVKDGGLGIPVVLVIVEGGTDAIKDAMSSLHHDIPVVVCSSTGRAADIIAYAYSHTKGASGSREITPKHLTKLRDKILEAYGAKWKEDEQEKEIDKIQNMVQKCCEKSNLITVFNMNKQEDLDLAILSALLKATSGASEDQRLKQLKLALTWNRVDIAQEEIFREDVLWKPDSLNDTLVEAILTDKIKFIELILQQGSVLMKEFLTANRLNELYMKVPKTHFIYRLMFKLTRKEELTKENIDLLLCKLLDRVVDDTADLTTSEVDLDDMDDEEIHDYMHKEDVFKHPYKHLMIWAVLMHRQNLAKFCWERGDEPVTSAIAMTWLYRAIARNITRNESELRDLVLLYKDEFEELATGVLDECHQKDPEKAMMIVERRSPTWNEMTCLQMAASANDQIFIASEACLNSVDTIWKSGILSRWIKIFVSVWCPLYVLFSMEFIEGKKSLTWYQKLSTFFTAPTTKFLYRMILYILFLCLHSYMVLVDFDPGIIKPLEIVCTVWIFSFVLDKLHTIIAFPSPTLKLKFRDFVGFTDLLEVTNYGMCFIGFILHIFDYTRATKVLYCLNAVFFIINLTKYYTASPILGPKLIMITRMLKELSMFLIVVVVFLLAYGISSQGLLYKERSPNWVILKDIVYYPYWQLYGEIFLEELETEECAAGSMDCRTFHWLVPILLGVYLLVGNILLLTLLIAIFSNVFDHVEKNAQTISKYYMYYIVMEYDVKVFFAPPLSIVHHLYLTINWLFRHTCCENEKEKQTLGKRHLEYLQLFEQEMMTNMLRQKKKEELISLETTIGSLQKRVDDLTRLIEDEVIADAHVDQGTMLPTLSRGGGKELGRESTVVDNRPGSAMSTLWPNVQEVLTVKDKVNNSSIPSQYFQSGIPPLKKSDSAALLVMPSEQGPNAFMTIPVTLSGERTGDTTKIMVQELRTSQQYREPAKSEEGTNKPDTEPSILDKTELDHVKHNQSTKETELIDTTAGKVDDKDLDVHKTDVLNPETKPKVKRRSSSKKKRKNKKEKADNVDTVNNVNRPHSSIERGDQQHVHFLLPDSDQGMQRPHTAAYRSNMYGRGDMAGTPGRQITVAGKSRVEITDLDAVYGEVIDDKAPLTAWGDDSQNWSTLQNQHDEEPAVNDGSAKDKKKKKKKNKKHRDDAAEDSV